MWGMGAPDQETIPAYIQAALHEQFGDRICVTNQAELGFVSTQELIRLMKQFQHNEAPHLAVFYDGVNDTIAAYNSGEAGVHRNLGPFVDTFQGKSTTNPLVDWLMHTYLVTFVRGLIGVPNPAPVIQVDYRQLGDDVASVYLSNVKMGNTLADAYNIQTIFIWQPIMVVGNKVLTDEEKIMEEVVPDNLLTTYQEAWAQVEASVSDEQRLYSVADVFDGIEEPLYIDHHHLAPQGNQIVAQRIVEIITPTITAALSN
jgi:hypothetical protein